MTSAAATVDTDKNDFRVRLLDALEASIVEDGYQKTTVADIVRRARTSRRTFYEHFASREECFMALLLAANAEQVRRVAGAVDQHAPWRDQVRQAVEAWIASGEEHPEMMLSWIRDVASLGESARDLQRETMGNFVDMVQAMTDTDEFHAAGVEVSRPRIIMLLGGLRELTAITVESGGRMSDITEDAVSASIAILEPRG